MTVGMRLLRCPGDEFSPARESYDGIHVADFRFEQDFACAGPAIVTASALVISHRIRSLNFFDECAIEQEL
jgi:hypothetical protein